MQYSGDNYVTFPIVTPLRCRGDYYATFPTAAQWASKWNNIIPHCIAVGTYVTGRVGRFRNIDRNTPMELDCSFFTPARRAKLALFCF